MNDAVPGVREGYPSLNAGAFLKVPEAALPASVLGHWDER
jgi:hypothetical protein